MSSNIKDVQTLKGLQSQLTKIDAEMSLIRSEISRLNKDFKSKQESRDSIATQIERLKNDGNLKVSEHAMLRYLERKLGINISEIEKEILNEKILEQYKILGNGRFVHPNNYQVVIKGNMVVSIINND